MAKLCTTCDAENRDEAKFCKGCGGKFAFPAASTASVEGFGCPSCGHLNKAGAKFCSTCGGQTQASILPPPPPPPAPPPTPRPPAAVDARPRQAVQPAAIIPQPRVQTQAQTPADASAAPSRVGVWIGVAIASTVVVAAATWFLVGHSVPTPASMPAATAPPSAMPLVAAGEATVPAVAAANDASPAAITTPAALATPAEPGLPKAAAPTAGPPAVTGSTPDAAALERARQAREKLDSDTRARTAAEQQRIAEQKQHRREEEAARQRADEARQRAVVPPPVNPAPIAPPAAQAALPQTVRQACSGSSNVVSELLCRTRECRKPANAADPICVKFKEIEDKNAQRVEQ